MENINTKSDRRNKKRITKSKKWIKHAYGKNWGEKHGDNVSTELKRIIKSKTNFIKNKKNKKKC